MKLKRKKFKVAFKTFQTFKIQSFIIGKITELLEFSPTFRFFQLFQIISCSKKPVFLYRVMLNSELKFSSIAKSFRTCSKIKTSINWISALNNCRSQEATKFLLTFPIQASFLIFNPFGITPHDLVTSRKTIW